MSRRNKVKKQKNIRWFVYMHNNTDSRDDEIYDLYAIDEADAREVAYTNQNWPGRFSIGKIEKAGRRRVWWATKIR